MYDATVSIGYTLWGIGHPRITGAPDPKQYTSIHYRFRQLSQQQRQ
jgi:hypothetical protein